MAPGRAEGIFKLKISDANNEQTRTVLTINTAVDMPTISETTPSERKFLEYKKGGIIPAFGKLLAYFTITASDNVVAADSKIHIPITLQNLAIKGQPTSEDVLTAEDFDLWQAAGATGIACVAGEEKLLGTYQLGYQLNMVLGVRSAEGLDKSNSKMLVVPYNDTA